MKRTKDYLLLFLKGMGMGSADIIPGVSGGTIALITGIYEELLCAIRSLNATALRSLRARKWRAFWQYIHGSFLLTLSLGISTSILTTVNLLCYILTQYPIQTGSFFLGLILVSSITVYQQVKKFTYSILFISFIGAIVAYTITCATPIQTPEASWFIFVAGAVAVCAMILPGISGSFILLILGKYTLMLAVLKDLQWRLLSVFMLGGITGLLSFSRLLTWLLRRYHDSTIALLAGFMLGSVPKIWPWKQLLKPLSSEGLGGALVGANISPVQFRVIYQQDPLILQALLWMGVGCLLVLTMDKLTPSRQLPHYFS
ncbi:MAG: DUF368 domain-containing protein [Bacteroidota bacterium]